MKILKGQFWHDSSEEKPEFHVKGTNTIISDIDYSKNPDVPLNILLEIVLDGNILHSWRTDPSSPLAFKNTTTKNIAVTRVEREGVDFTDNDRRKIKRWAKKLQDEYRWLSQEKWDVDVDVFFYNTDGGQGLRDFDWRELKQYLSENYPENNYNYFHGVGSFGNVCGRAWVDGNEAWTYPNCTSATLIHEQGHNFGLHHAGKNSDQYGEKDVWMGSGRQRNGMNAPHIYTLGLIEDNNIDTFESGDSKISYLVEGETIDLAVPMGANRIAVLNDRNRPRVSTVSLHQGKIDIHIPFHMSSNSIAKTKIVATLDVGEAYEEFGMKIDYISHEDHIAKVSIKNRTNDDPIDNKKFPSYVSPENADVFDGKSGVWENPAWNYQGIHLRHLKDRNQVYVAWISWDRTKNPEWHFGVLDIESNVARGDLRTGRDGEISGTAELFFYNDNDGLFRTKTEEHGLFSMPLERVSIGTESQLNGYFALGDSGQGISIELTSLNTVVAYLLTYRDPSIPIGPVGEKTDWKVLIGNFNEELTVYSVKGGRLGVKTDAEVIEEGTARIENNELHYNGNTYNLVRLA